MGLLSSGLNATLDGRIDPIVVHPVLGGRGPTSFQGLSSARHLELVSAHRFESGAHALHFRQKAA